MKCISLSTLGLIVGGINIFGGVMAIIYIIKELREFDNRSKNDKDPLITLLVTLYITLIICVIVIIISILLILGIMKKRHTLMKPWIYCSVASFVCQGFVIAGSLVMGLVNNQPLVMVFELFIYRVLILGFQVLIFYAIHKLYKNIREAARQKAENTVELEDK